MNSPDRKKKKTFAKSSSTVHHVFISTKRIDSRAYSMKSTCHSEPKLSQIEWWKINECIQKNLMNNTNYFPLLHKERNPQNQLAYREKHVCCCTAYRLSKLIRETEYQASYVFNNHRQSYWRLCYESYCLCLYVGITPPYHKLQVYSRSAATNWLQWPAGLYINLQMNLRWKLQISRLQITPWWQVMCLKHECKRDRVSEREAERKRRR